MAEAEAPIFWLPDVKSQLIGKDHIVGKDWRQVENQATKDEMVEWHHWFNRYEFKKAPGESEGQGIWCAVVYGVAKSQIGLSN